jgi:hypothetical protein
LVLAPDIAITQAAHRATDRRIKAQYNHHLQSDGSESNQSRNGAALKLDTIPHSKGSDDLCAGNNLLGALAYRPIEMLGCMIEA